MANKELLKTIRKEIISRIDKRHLSKQAQNELVSILSFLSTFKSEKTMNLEDDLEEEIKRYGEKNMFNIPAFQQVARHFAEWGYLRAAEKYNEIEYNRQRAEESGSSEIPNCLNELADYARRQVEELLPVIKKYNDYSEEQIEELRTHLMAMFLEGAGWQKEQMMKEAVEGYVTFNRDAQEEGLPYATVIANEKPLEFYESRGFKLGDKVRIIIVKEDEK